MMLAFFSDRTQVRGVFVAGANIFGIIGYILIICPTPHGVKFLGTFLCAIAVYTGPGLNMSWLNVNVAPQCTFISLLLKDETLTRECLRSPSDRNWSTANHRKHRRNRSRSDIQIEPISAWQFFLPWYDRSSADPDWLQVALPQTLEQC